RSRRRAWRLLGRRGWLDGAGTSGILPSRARAPAGCGRPGRGSAEESGIRLAEEGGDAIGFGGVAKTLGGLPKHRERTQEAAVRLMRGGDRALAAPAGATQRVQAAVVAGARVGVGGDLVAVAQRILRERCPGERRVEVAGRDLLRLAVDELCGDLDIHEVVGEAGLGDPEKVPAGEVIGTISHDSIVGAEAR